MRRQRTLTGLLNVVVVIVVVIIFLLFVQSHWWLCIELQWGSFLARARQAGRAAVCRAFGSCVLQFLAGASSLGGHHLRACLLASSKLFGHLPEGTGQRQRGGGRQDWSAEWGSQSGRSQWQSWTGQEGRRGEWGAEQGASR